MSALFYLPRDGDSEQAQKYEAHLDSQPIQYHYGTFYILGPGQIASSLSAQKDVQIASSFFASMTGPTVPHRPPETPSV